MVLNRVEGAAGVSRGVDVCGWAAYCRSGVGRVNFRHLLYQQGRNIRAMVVKLSLECIIVPEPNRRTLDRFGESSICSGHLEFLQLLFPDHGAKFCLGRDAVFARY